MDNISQSPSETVSMDGMKSWYEYDQEAVPIGLSLGGVMGGESSRVVVAMEDVVVVLASPWSIKLVHVG